MDILPNSVSGPFENLRYLAECYFHQDYDADFADVDDVVRDFCRRETRGTVAGLRDDLEGLRALGRSEEELSAMWHVEWRAWYEPGPDGRSLEQWFAHLLHLITLELGNS